MTFDTEQLQKALIARGYNVGTSGADGVFGRDTIAAVTRFQKDQHLDIQFPGTVGQKTITALGLTEHVAPAMQVATNFAPWLDLCIRKKGLHERINHEELMKFLSSDGHTLGDPSKLPWCGDLVETCIALTCPHERLPANPYFAANWATWGQHVKPTRGAIMSFWRGSPDAGTGHVAFYWSESDDAYNIWGGNQSDRISLTSIAKNRLRKNGSRWPLTVPLPGTGTVAGESGKLSTNEA